MLPQPAPRVVFQKLEDGAVLFSPETETYFGLNLVGAIIWEALPESASLPALCDRISGRFPDVDAVIIRNDVEELLAELSAAGLLHTSSSTDDGTPS